MCYNKIIDLLFYCVNRRKLGGIMEKLNLQQKLEGVAYNKCEEVIKKSGR